MLKKHIISILFILFFVSGCTSSDSVTIEIEYKHIRCIEGVNYFLFIEEDLFYRGYGFMSPKFNTDGSISTCG